MSEDMERTIILIFVLCTTMGTYSVMGTDLPEAFPYTLQEIPIKFTKEPESKSVLSGTTVTLSCNTTIIQSNNYRLPELLWRYNGQLLDNSLSTHLTVKNLPDNGRSELKIAGVSQRDSGYYECVVYDGYYVLESGEVAYVTVTSSKRAELEVIDVDLNVSEQEQAVSAILGGHLLLHCETGAQHPPMQPSWKKDGQPFIPSQNEVVLRNGNLLILKTNLTSAGTYQCTGHYNKDSLNSTTYNVSISEGDDSCSPVVITDGPDGVVEVGEQLTITCYALNSEGLQVQWLKNGQVLQEGLSSVENVFRISEVSVLDSGSYMCQILSSLTPVSRTELNVTVASKPSVDIRCFNRLCHDDFIRGSQRDLTLKLTCDIISDSASTIYWYKNGEDFIAHANGNVLTYKASSLDGLMGVYQCFAVSPAGVNYDTLRVIRAGFSNPPGNFACQAIDQSSNVTKPSVVLHWERPTLQAYYLNQDNFVQPPTSGAYKVVYDAGGIMHTVTVDLEADMNNTAVVDLPEDMEYTFSVYFYDADFSGSRVAIETCSVNTGLRRITIPRRLDISCPDTVPANSDNATIPVEWISPEKCYDFRLRLLNYRSICLYGNNTYVTSETFTPFACVDDRVYSFEAGPLPLGSVCHFGGWYFINFHLLYIPTVNCGIPKPQSTGRAQLRLSCYNSMASVNIVTAKGDVTLNSAELHGKCITPENPLGTHEHHLEPGNTSISDLPDGTICSFYGSYKLKTAEIEDFEPAQCIVSHLAPPTSQVMTLSPTTAPPDENSQTTTEGTGFTLSHAAITWVAVNISLIAVVIVTVVVACFVWKSYSRKVIKERRKRLHIWDDFITKQEGADNLDQDPLVLPQFPCTCNAPDSLSITTEVDYLYKEEGRTVISHNSLSSLMKSMKNDEKAIESPKLIMDRFLNGCHERVWESSHESLCNIPPSQRQDSGKLSENCKENAYEDTDPVPCSAHLNSDSHTSTAQHYTIPLQTESLPNVKVSGTDSYIPSGGSSGYGTCSDHYFESGSSVCMSRTSDYYKLRLADVAECNSLSTCEEEEGHQTVVEIVNHSRKSSHDHGLECSMNPVPDGTATIICKESLNKPNRPHRVISPFEHTGNLKYDDVTTSDGDHINFSSTCTNNELLNRRSSLGDYTPSSVPPEHCFTDDEGYLRFTKETAV